MDFNVRLKRAGGKILYVPDIVVRYSIRSNFKDFFKHDFWGGVWVVYVMKLTGRPLRPRHYAPIVFAGVGLALLALGFFYPISFGVLFSAVGLYALLSLYFSIKIAQREKEGSIFFLMPIAFASRHAAYALGSIFGFLKIIAGKPNKN